MGRVDRYIFAVSARPFLMTLGVVLIALVLERVLRLFDLLAQTSISVPVVVELAANLVPHYLGLALPAAFFVAVFSVVARFDDNNEIDAMMASGLSISRITLPFLAMGGTLMIVSLVLFGFVQPYSRYAYRAMMSDAASDAWDGRAQAATFFDAPNGIVLSADQVDATGMRLGGVFLRERLPTGIERITTARAGRIEPNPEPDRLTLVLLNGRAVEMSLQNRPRLTQFEQLVTTLPYRAEEKPFRDRGEDERELTLAELAAGMKGGLPGLAPSRLASEFNERLARALSLPLLPLLALPLAMVTKRGRRGAGLGLAAVVLFGYQHALQFGASLADSGRLHPLPAIWTPFLAFAALCTWLFLSSRTRPGDNPVSRLAAVLDRGLAAAWGWLSRRRGEA